MTTTEDRTYTRPVEDRDWITRAACRGHSRPDIFYPDKGGPLNGHEALRICASCPVKRECGDDAESRNEPFGIWAGKARRGTSLGSPHRRIPAEVRAVEDKPADLQSHRCERCGLYWGSTCGPREHFNIIATYCPICIARLPAQVYA